MNSLKELSDKKIIMSMILRFTDQFQVGERFRSEDIIKFVHRYHRRYIYGDTILRYARILRSQGKLSYKCTSKRERIFEIV